MNIVIDTLLVVLAAPALLASTYLLGMTLLSAALPKPPASSRQLKFDVIVPAHNEHAVIERTVQSLRKIDWPKDRFRILVIADNCNDDTAALARNAGAEVLERSNLLQRGKGYALDFAFRASRSHGFADAVVVIDADSEVSANLLEAIAARLEAGADAVQVHYGTLNPMDSWRTRLLTIAKAAFHIARSRARERLGLSCGIRGNGWCITHRLQEQVPYQAFSLTEDLEYGITLGFAGYRVVYADEAHSDADMVSNSQAAGQQRRRWEGGRFQLIRSKTLPLLVAAIKRRNAVCFDLAMDLLVLPLSYVALNIAILLAVATAAVLLGVVQSVWVWIGVACSLSLVIYTMRGWQLSGVGIRGLLDLAIAPFFLAWKLVVMLRPQRSSEWIRTEREDH